MRKKFSQPVILIFVAFFFFLVSCSKKKNNTDDLPLGWTAVNIENYVSEYSPLRISTADPIMVRFAKIPDQLTATPDNELPAEIANMDPFVSGKWVWQDALTLVFKPDQSLSSNQRYEVTFDLNKLFKNVPEKEAKPILAIATIEQQLTLSHEGLEYLTDDNGNTIIQVKGWVNCLDNAKNEEIEKSIEVFQEGNKGLTLRWEHLTGKEHTFFISGVKRSEKESTLEIKYDATDIDSDFKGSKQLKVVGLNEFVFLESKVNRNGSKTIDLIFSDPLDENQEKKGLVTIIDWEDEFAIDINGNRLTIYLEQFPGNDLKMEVSSGLKNKSGKNLGQVLSSSFSFLPAKPEVKALRKGVIMPETEQVWFPFQAINLKSVEIEITKIYQSNVLQFLQYNALDQHYDLNPVGKIMFTGKVDLTKISPANNEEKWQKYTLDLSRMVTVDPGSIYNIEIRFSKEDVIKLECEAPNNEGEYGDTYYDDGYYDESNPCRPYYYYGDHFIRTNLFSTNIGLLAKGSRDEKSWTLFANHLTTATGLSGTEITLFDFQKQEVGKGVTDANGLISIECNEAPSFAMAKKDGKYGYLSLLDHFANSLSDFDINGKELKEGLDAFIYGERGVYRPGDTMFVSVMLFQHNKKGGPGLDAQLPIKIQAEDSRGKIQFEKNLTENIDHLYHCKIPTTASSPTGNWKWMVSAGGETFYKSVKVETVKPNRLKIRYKNLPGTIKLYQEPTLSFESTWLHGASAEGLKSEVEVTWNDRIQTFKNFPAFSFEDPARGSDYYPEKMFSASLDQDGSGSYQLKQNPSFLPASGLKVGIKTKVFEKSGNFSEDYTSADVHPYTSYVGIKIPESEWGGHYLKSGIAQKIAMVVVDADGKPVANRDISIGLYTAEWNWWYNESNYNLLKFNSSDHTGSIKTARIKTNEKGMAEWSDVYEDYGNYLIRVCDDVSGHCTGGLFYTSKWGNPPSHGEAAQIIKLSSDKESYNTGEKIKLRIPSNEKSKILLSIEQGNHIISTQLVEGKAKETLVDVVVTPAMAPNVFLHVSLVQPYANTANGLPLRMYGVLPVKITDPSRTLHPVVEAPSTLKPDETFTLKVKEQNNRPMAYTIAVVDEGLLDLTRFKTPNPTDHFFAKLALGIDTWDMYDKVMNPYGQEFENLFTVGGDADNLNLNSVKKANRFVPTVKFLGPFQSKGGITTHNLKIEKYVGSVRIMVIARNNDAFGMAEATRQVKKDLMVQTTLPRILAPGDEFDLGANVFAMVKNLGKINVSLEVDKGFFTTGNPTNSLTFEKEGDLLTQFGIKAGNSSGIAKIGAKVSSARMSTKDITEIEIRNPNLPEIRVREFKIEAGQKVNLPLDLFGTKGSHTAQLEISNMPSLNLNSRLQYLITYPYGCIEQTTSAAFPQLYVGDIIHLSPGRQKEVNQNITKAIQRITGFQTSSGGFAYWPGNNTSEDWASTYAGHFLIEAKAQNYFVPEKLLSKWYAYQKSQANKYNTNIDADHTAQAYRLYTLAKYGKPESGAMNKLRQAKNLTAPAGNTLAAAFALAGKKQVATELLVKVAKLNVTNPKEDYNYYTYGSTMRDMALKAEAQMQTGQTSQALNTIRAIVQELNSSGWYNTQAISHALLVVEKFYKGADKKGLIVNLAYNGKALTAINTNKSIAVSEIAINESSNQQTITLSNGTKGPIYVKTIIKGTPGMNQTLPASAKNVQLFVSYVDNGGRPIDANNLAQGQSFIARIKATNPGTFGTRLENMALTFQLPAGWEVSNERLNGVTSRNTNYEYQDIRDDKVITFFDLYKGSSTNIEIPLIATYSGIFYQAPVTIEAMYNNEVYARIPSARVKVVKSKDTNDKKLQ
ncbi:MAG: hypothetical protein IPJ54_15245 [Saprospiraceae bacterium]|nr:hypothetical protein [Saprospiraceae bacterium]